MSVHHHGMEFYTSSNTHILRPSYIFISAWTSNIAYVFIIRVFTISSFRFSIFLLSLAGAHLPNLSFPQLYIFFSSRFIQFYNTVFFPAVIQSWAQPHWVVNCPAPGCWVRIEPATGSVQQHGSTCYNFFGLASFISDLAGQTQLVRKELVRHYLAWFMMALQKPVFLELIIHRHEVSQVREPQDTVLLWYIFPSHNT